MRIPKHFIWRLTKGDPWRVYGVTNHFRPSYPPDGQPVVWEGDDYHDGLKECDRLNREQKNLKK